MILSVDCKTAGVIWPSKGRAKLRSDRARKVACPDETLFRVLPQRSNNLLVGTWFRKHLHRTPVPLIVPTIEDEKCLAMTYHLGITSHE